MCDLNIHRGRHRRRGQRVTFECASHLKQERTRSESLGKSIGLIKSPKVESKTSAKEIDQISWPANLTSFVAEAISIVITVVMIHFELL